MKLHNIYVYNVWAQQRLKLKTHQPQSYCDKQLQDPHIHHGIIGFVHVLGREAVAFHGPSNAVAHLDTTKRLNNSCPAVELQSGKLTSSQPLRSPHFSFALATPLMKLLTKSMDRPPKQHASSHSVLFQPEEGDWPHGRCHGIPHGNHGFLPASCGNWANSSRQICIQLEDLGTDPPTLCTAAQQNWGIPLCTKLVQAHLSQTVELRVIWLLFGTALWITNEGPIAVLGSIWVDHLSTESEEKTANPCPLWLLI